MKLCLQVKRLKSEMMRISRVMNMNVDACGFVFSHENNRKCI